MSKNARWILHRGVHSVHIGVLSAVTHSHRGRPEPESGTPVNMENRLHCDNGEGVAATPPPYPLGFPPRKWCYCRDAPPKGLRPSLQDGRIGNREAGPSTAV